MNKIHTLTRRYTAKLATNLLGMIFNFINASLIPRALGPIAYGNFEYLMNFFQQITGFVDTGTSTAFYNKLSRRNEDLGLIKTYSQFVFIVFFFILTCIGIVWSLKLENTLWPNQQWESILLAALLSYLMWIQEVSRKIIDAFGCTIKGEITMAITKAIGVITTIILFIWSWLNLTNQFFKEIITVSLIIFSAILILVQHWRVHLKNQCYSSNKNNIIKELWIYASPLLVVATVGLITGIGDRWLLDRYSGADEQGFFSLSFRIAGVSLLFTTAMTQLIMREYSRHHEQDNFEQMRKLFIRYVPMLFTIAVYFSAFISLQADTVISILGGKDYSAAGPAMMIMALYPAHQTYGQMNGAILMATEKTKLYRNIGVFSMLTGLITTFYFLAPTEQGGLDSGSFGLAIKMVLIQIIAVNTQLWFNLKFLNLKFKYFFIRQIAVIVSLLTLAWIAKAIVQLFQLPNPYEFLCAGITYTIFFGFFILLYPLAIGITRIELNTLLNERLNIKTIN